MLSACNSEAEDTEENEETIDEPAESEEEQDESEQEETNDEDAAEETEEEQEENTEYLYEVSENYATINVIEGKEANEQVALLTYDDAPDGYALDIAETLVEHDAPAIFFVNGMYLDDEGAEIIEEIYEMGFEIGNHTETHPNLTTISEEEQYEEIIGTSDRVEEITGERPRFFRAPFGANTEFSTQTALEDGMMLMNWTYGFDWEAEYVDNPEGLAEIMVDPVTPEGSSLLVPGANLLMHDREWTLEATPAIIEGLREKEYEILDPALIQSVESENDNESEEADE